MTQTRTNMATNAPASYTALGKLAEAAEQEAIQSGLEPTVLDLIKIRVSQLNGCAFCLRMHTRESLAAGETSDRLAVLPAWRESQYFNPREQAALSVAEAITMIATTAGDDPAYSFARQHLDDKQLAAVVWVAIAINGYNRVAISGHYHVGNLKQQSHNGIRTSAPPDHFANPRVREIHMKLNRFRTILCAAATALVSASALTVGAGPAAADQLPTVVLVHGAFADTTSWDGVALDLRNRGYTVVVPDIALRGPAYDARGVERVVSQVHGPVILVGHSYGGVVVTNVHATNVEALVYVAAFIPAQGEPAMLALNPIQYPGSQLLPPALQIKPVNDPTGPFGKNLDAYISPDYFHDIFAQDVSNSTAATMFAHQKSQALSANLEPTGVPLWKTTPSWALVPYNDRVIPRSSELAMAQRASAHVTSVPGSHAVLVSQPHAVADLVTAADAGA